MIDEVVTLLRQRDVFPTKRHLQHTAFAPASYCLAHGDDPEKLSQLVLMYLAKVPHDLYKKTPGPIGYRRDGKGYLV